MADLDTDDNFVSFGTALEPIEDEEVVRKKPITIEEQIATDEQGRRRFHGAFTGGFSAGYYNTVGSKEGWTPSTFKSSRAERFGSSSRGQNVTDFMDDEDLGAFGIAPQVLRPTNEFSATSNSNTEAQSSGRKRPKPKQSDGPIPGVPVLHQIIEPVKETVGIRILVKMGWRPGQGVGPRISKKAKDKKKTKSKLSLQEEKKSDEIEKPEVILDEEELESIKQQKVYGCVLPESFQRKEEAQPSSSEEEDIDADVLYAPDDVESPLCNPKENTFGLGYKGLERMSDSVGHVDLFGGKQLKFRVDNKKMNITGEAFGIGAFEEPDEDVYTHEDMNKYDFELETAEERRARKTKEALEKEKKKKQKDSCIDGFLFAKNDATLKKKYFPPPHLPHDFQPIHKQRKSRFDKPTETVGSSNKDDSNSSASAARRGLGRHALTVQERQVLLGEQSSVSVTEEPVEEETVPQQQSTATTAKDESSIQERVERIKKFVQVLQAHTPASNDPTVSQPRFQPFLKNPEKQDRYEKYLTLVSAGFQDSLKDLQPVEMTEWEREREKQEFERARDIYKPLSGVMSSRFTSAKSHDISHIVPEREILKERDPTEDPKVAAKLNLFGKLTHCVVQWHPEKTLCKRFNIKDPYPESKFVGLHGVSSIGAQSRKTLNEVQKPPEPEPAGIITLAAPKKSLFDNLDFSKPPPGLPGLGPPSTTTHSDHPAGLEFQRKIQAAESEEAQDETPIVKAPLDLFKQIFADSSESEEENESEHQNKSTKTGKNQKEEIKKDEKSSDRNDANTGRRREEKLDVGKVLYDKRYNSGASNSNHKAIAVPDTTTTPRPRSVFDNLDLNELSGKKQSQSAEKDKGESDSEDSYGPKAPATSAATVIPSKPQFTLGQMSSSHPKEASSSKPSSSKSKSGEDDNAVVWVEKEVVSQKSKKHSSSKKSKKTKAKKDKSKDKKHKKNKKQKKSSKKKSSSGRGHLSPPNSSEDEDGGSDDSSSSVEVRGSLNQRALLAQLKQITKSH